MLRLGVLDQSPVRSGGNPADAIHETLELAEAVRPARLPSLLARRAPLDAGPGRLEPRGPDRPGRGAHLADPRRLRRRHAPALQRAQGRRELPRARDALPGPHRSRHRPRARERPADRPRARARTRAASSTSRSRVADLLGFLHGDLPAEPPLRAGARDADRPDGARGLAARLERPERARSPRTSAPASRSRTSSTPTAAPRSRAPIARQFPPSPQLDEPRASAAVFVVCADTEAEARRLAKSRELFIVRLYTGRLGRYPSSRRPKRTRTPRASWPSSEHAQQRTVAGAPSRCGRGSRRSPPTTRRTS